MAELHENVIEWITGEDTISVTMHQGRYVSKIRKLAEKHPNLVQILAENPDGSIFAHMPISCLKLSLKSLSETQILEQRERLRMAREKRGASK